MEQEKDNIEIIERDDFRGEQIQQFSHQQLVMKAMMKCLDFGCREMRSGYVNQKSDRFGNVIRIYIEDTRKVFIASVNILETFMDCDLEDNKEEIKKIKEEIKKIKEELKKTYNTLCNMEKKDLEQAPLILQKERIKKGIYYREDSLNANLPYSQEYIEEEVNAHRNILNELNKLTKELDYYAEEEWAA